MQFDLDIKSQDGVDYAFFSDPDPRRLLVNFSSMNPGKFERWSWFRALDNAADPSAYLFFKDEGQYYYLGRKGAPISDALSELIRSIAAQSGLGMESCISIGSSMGGYASIYYALKLGLRACISLNPQVDRQSAELHRFTLWSRKMNESEWIDLDDFARRFKNPSTSFFLLSGMYAADVKAAERIVSAFDAISAKYTHRVVSSEEHGWVGLSRDELVKLVYEIVPP